MMRRTSILVTGAAIAGAGYVLAPMATAATASTISGVAFYDDNRDGVLDNGEQPISGESIYLMTPDESAFVASTTTSSTGSYSFTSLSDGNYLVEVDPSDWLGMRGSWVPTTTGSVWPQVQVSVSSSTATANFGWRALVTSTDVSSPISSYTGPEGLRVQSYNDAVTAKTIHDALTSTGNIGAEAPSIIVRFGYGSQNQTNPMWQLDNGTYVNYQATTYSSYDNWLSDRGATLFHEYGHAWSMYFATIVQSDPNLTGYLQARGLANDSRVDSSYQWDRRELIAEDFRELFGSPAAQARVQMNTSIPNAADVPGLRDYLYGAFRQTPTSTTNTSTSTTGVTVTALAISPAPVKKSGTVSFTLSAAAMTSVSILDSGNNLVRQLLNQQLGAGAAKVTWDRTDSKGHRVVSGSYQVVVKATTTSGASGSASVAFQAA